MATTRSPSALDRSREVYASSSGGRVALLAEITRKTSAPSTSRIKKMLKVARASFRGNRRDLRALIRRVGGYARVCVGELKERGRREKRPRVPPLEIFLFRSISQMRFRGAFA